MRDIQKEIQDNMNAVEERYDVKIMLAVESGSRKTCLGICFSGQRL